MFLEITYLVLGKIRYIFDPIDCFRVFSRLCNCTLITITIRLGKQYSNSNPSPSLVDSTPYLLFWKTEFIGYF